MDPGSPTFVYLYGFVKNQSLVTSATTFVEMRRLAALDSAPFQMNAQTLFEPPGMVQR